MKALIIEDEMSIIEAINVAFEFRWPEVKLVSAITGKDGIEKVRIESPDIVILDINLPDISGFSVLKKVREFSSVPVIILTVRSEDADILKGLETGADDYVIKPFNILTLLARIKAVLRRTDRVSLKENSAFVSPRLKIDVVNQKVRVDNRLVKLTPVEYRLLMLLAKNRGKMVSHKSIMQEIWGREFDGRTQNIRIYVQRLRKKLFDSPPSLIINEHGAGYSVRG